MRKLAFLALLSVWLALPAVADTLGEKDLTADETAAAAPILAEIQAEDAAIVTYNANLAASQARRAAAVERLAAVLRLGKRVPDASTLDVVTVTTDAQGKPQVAFTTKSKGR